MFILPAGRAFATCGVLILIFATCRPCGGQPAAKGIGGPESVQAIATALKSPTNLKFAGTPFRQVIEQLQGTAGVPLKVDQRAVMGTGISAQTPITANCKDALRVDSAILITLRQVGLVCVWQPGGLLVTTPAGARQRGGVIPGLTMPKPLGTTKESRVAAKLTEALASPTDTNFVESPLTEVVTHLKEHHRIPIFFYGPAFYKVKTDPRAVKVTQNLKGISLRSALLLMLDQHGLTCAQQDEFLVVTTLREAKFWGGPLVPAAKLAAAAAGAQMATKMIQDALDSPTQLEFTETPLPEVINNLQNRHSIPIMIDRRALTTQKIPADTKITHNVKEVPLKDALESMLDEHNLTYQLAHEVLVITTHKRAGTKPKTVESEKPDDKQPAAPAFRTWKDRTGKYKIVAQFRGVSDGKVQLRKTDGSTVAVPLIRLSTEDQTWVRRQR